jgi:hypothetical protein
MNVLQAKATVFIKASPFFQAMHTFGGVVFTGSYALDTMTWPDIDVQLKLGSPANALRATNHLSELLLQDPTTIRFQYINFKDYPRDTLPKGLCIGAQIADPALQDIFPQQPYWKVDFWILEEKDFEENRQFMAQLMKKMTPAHKTLIMGYKEDWTKQWGRPPQLGSYFLYQAVVFEGLKDEEDILKYLRENNVKI